MSVGDRVVTNADLTQWMDTTEEWIEQRTGILERRWVAEGQKPSTLARDATLAALEQAGLEVSDIDCILLATLSGEHDFPGTSFFLHEAIDAGDIPCIDLRAQCSGFLYALQMADALIVAGRYERVLVVEDVITTGGSVLEVGDVVKQAGGRVVAYASIVDRSGGRFDPKAPFFSCLETNIPIYGPDDCPLCKKGEPFVKPGSRSLK